MGEAPDTVGILACAAYVPRHRILRETLASATGWALGKSRSARGERSFGNWDEDSVTFAVEAARRALGRLPANTKSAIGSLQLASTSLPFADRSHAGIVREALNLPDRLGPADLSGSRRAATAALCGLAGSVTSRTPTTLLCASDCVDALPASEGEQDLGHAGAALVVGTGEPVAAIRAHRSLHEDFVDRYRAADQRFDYRLESRWFREAGTREQLPGLVREVLHAAGREAAKVSAFLTPLPADAERIVARACGLEQAGTAASLRERVGICGAAHPLLMLAWALEQAAAGDLLLLVGAGQGFDVLLIEVLASATPGSSRGHDTVEAQLAAGRLEPNYVRYAGLRRLLPMDTGLRGERDTRTAHSAHYRRHDDITGFTGGRCAACGKLQFPLTRICVHCQADGQQSAEPMAELPGTVNSFTEDWLAYSPRPPLMFGNIHFPDGANVMMEFSDFEPSEVETGQTVRMAFRIKDHDTRRHFRRYFWKPVPAVGEAEDG